jgi:hypothetical protein
MVPYELAAGSITDVVDGPCVLWKLVLQGGAAAAGTAQLFNGTVTTEDLLFSCGAATADTVDFDFTAVDGLPFSSKLGVKVEGAGSVAYLWYES